MSDIDWNNKNERKYYLMQQAYSVQLGILDYFIQGVDCKIGNGPEKIITSKQFLAKLREIQHISSDTSLRTIDFVYLMFAMYEYILCGPKKLKDVQILQLMNVPKDFPKRWSNVLEFYMTKILLKYYGDNTVKWLIENGREDFIVNMIKFSPEIKRQLTEKVIDTSIALKHLPVETWSGKIPTLVIEEIINHAYNTRGTLGLAETYDLVREIVENMKIYNRICV